MCGLIIAVVHHNFLIVLRYLRTRTCEVSCHQLVKGLITGPVARKRSKDLRRVVLRIIIRIYT